MKTLEDLGISPVPWNAGFVQNMEWVKDVNGDQIVWINEDNRTAERTANALLYAAPDLYAALLKCLAAEATATNMGFDKGAAEEGGKA